MILLISSGRHTIDAIPYSGGGGSGTPGTKQTLTVSIVNTPVSTSKMQTPTSSQPAGSASGLTGGTSITQTNSTQPENTRNPSSNNVNNQNSNIAGTAMVAETVVYIYIGIIVGVAVMAIVACVVGMVIRKRRYGALFIQDRTTNQTP